MIRNRDELAGSPGDDLPESRVAAADGDLASARGLALDCVAAGVAAARPRRVVREAVELDDGGTLTVAGESYDLGEYDEVVVLGGGKAAGGVADALDGMLGERIDRGVVVTDDAGRAVASDDASETSEVADASERERPVATETGEVADDSGESSADRPRIEVREGDHPVPSERGVEGAQRVLELADEATADTLVLAVVTGGGSALLPAPAGDLSLADLRAVTADLLASGATVGEVNAVRKHCSALKGGRLAVRAAPARVVGLALSDVVGDDLGVVASGPLSPDESTYADALDVLDRHGIDAPGPVRERLERGGSEAIPETPTAGHPAFERVSVHVLADGTTALRAAAAVADDAGYDPLVLSSRVRGEAREAAKTHAAVVEEIRATGNPVEPPAVVLSGGETTVTVRGDGEGGPNLEFALSWALDVETPADAQVALAAVDTDGRDGGTDAAGALVDAGTVGDSPAADGARIDPATARDALAENDALGPLADADCAIRTGATGTNVNDLRVLVVGDGERATDD